MQWTDIEDISEALEDLYPNADILGLRFVDLRQKVMHLDGFVPNQSDSNEKILEAIQMAWLELRQFTQERA
jgi:FeS assembly protein IscX